MKNIKFALILLVVTLLAGVMSCSKESFNINKNPNNATDSTVAYNVLLPSALNSTARVVSRSWGWLQNYLGYWARSGTYAPNADEESYQITTSFQSGIWSGLYDNLYDYQAMQIGASKAGATFYEGIARIMKAHNFAMLVDIYGNVPYSEALKGASVTTPKYDKGLDIYKDLLRQLDAAIDQIKNADESETGPNANILTDDVMFGTKLFPATDIHEMKTHWIQFANTLKLRMLTKCMNGGIEINGTAGTVQTTVAGIDLANEFNIIDNEGSGFMTDFNAEVNPGYQADKGNPFYNLYVRDDAGSATSGSVYYKANAYACGDGASDPGYYNFNGDRRRTKFYTTNNSGAYRGVQYGLPPITENQAAALSGIGVGVYRGVDKPQWIMTKAESFFLQAECMNRGFMSGDPKSTLESGITASFVDLGLTTANATSYITGNAGYADVDYAAPALGADVAKGGLFTIMSQKWFALNAIAPFEVWSDYRRVDFSADVNHFVYGESVGYNPGPAISVYPSNTKTEIPARLLYPQSEYLYNPANVGAQPAAGAYPFAHVFWDLH